MAVIMSKQLVVPEGPSKGTLASDMEVGGSVFLNVEGTKTEFLIVHQGNPDTSLYDASCDGTWLLAKDIYTKMILGSQYVSKNSYADSYIHSYLNGTFLGLLDVNIQNNIKQVKIPYINASKSRKTGSNGLSTKAFLLSDAEVGFTSDVNSAPLIGTKLDYFPSGKNATSKRVAYIDGTAYCWWTRSPNASSSAYVITVSATGSALNGTSCDGDELGVRPALILPSTAYFDPDTMEFLGVA